MLLLSYHAIEMRPLRILEKRCIFGGITQNLPIMHHAYVAMIVFSTGFSMTWYKIVVQRSSMVYHGTSLSPLVFSRYVHTSLNPRVYTEKIQVPRGTFHGLSLKSVT